MLKRGKVIDKFRFSISGTVIPNITEQLAKSLGKLFDSSLKDSAAIQKASLELGTWLTTVDKSDRLVCLLFSSIQSYPASCGPF